MERVETAVEDHGKRITYLENKDSANDVRIANLCNTLKKQTKSINWLVGALLTGLLCFLLYAIRFAIFSGG